MSEDSKPLTDPSVESLTDSIARRMRDALTPFAKWAECPEFKGCADDEPLFSDDRYGATVGDLREAAAARAALTEQQGAAEKPAVDWEKQWERMREAVAEASQCQCGVWRECEDCQNSRVYKTGPKACPNCGGSVIERERYACDRCKILAVIDRIASETAEPKPSGESR